jgi:hypothetical protein
MKATFRLAIALAIVAATVYLVVVVLGKHDTDDHPTGPGSAIFEGHGDLSDPNDDLVGSLHYEGFQMDNAGDDGMMPMGDDYNDAPIEALF